MIKNLIIVLGFILLVAIGYYLFVLGDDGLTTGNEIVANQAEAETREFLRRLNELKSIELDTNVLTDDRFRDRVDFSAQVVQQTVGRDNPFLPAN